MSLPFIKQRSDSFKPEYQFAINFADTQLKDFWVAGDYNMEHDMHDFRTKLTKAERMMIIQTQRLFTHYEVNLGIEFWNGRFKRMFPRYEFERAGAVMGMMETAVHAPFYIQMIDALKFNTPDFYNEPFEDPELKKRLEFISSALRGKCDLRALAAMCFLEGTALFSSFSALISFRKPGGINAMKNMVSGLVHSCRDELIHCNLAAACFRQLLEESKLSPMEQLDLYNDVMQIAKDIVAHEELITKKLFVGGELRNITEKEINRMVEHRSVECCNLLGYEVEDRLTPNPIGDWFYVIVKSYNYGDFFSITQPDYEKSVDRTRFTWRTA